MLSTYATTSIICNPRLLICYAKKFRNKDNLTFTKITTEFVDMPNLNAT